MKPRCNSKRNEENQPKYYQDMCTTNEGWCREMITITKREDVDYLRHIYCPTLLPVFVYSKCDFHHAYRDSLGLP